MQPAQHATPAARLVVLHQLGNVRFLQHALARCFHKETAGIAMHLGTSSSTSGIAWGMICITARSSLEQGLPPTLVGEIPLHRAPQSLLHVTCGGQPSSASILLASIA